MAFVTTAVLIELLAEQGEVNLSEPDTIRTVFQAARENRDEMYKNPGKSILTSQRLF